MRNLVLLSLLVVSVIQTLRSPVFGVLSYTAISLVYPQSFAWGFAKSLPVAQIQLIATLISCAIHPSALRWKFPRELVLLLMFWAWTAVTTMFAMFPDRASVRFEYVSKVIFPVVLAVFVLYTREHLIWLVRTVALSLGFHGIRGGIATIGNGAKYMVYGPQNSFLESNNAIGLALAMNIPLLYFLARQESNIWVKRVMWTAAVLSVPGAVATFSRGAWLGLAAGMMMILLTLPFKWKVLAVVAVVVLALIAIPMMPERVSNRYEDLENYETEGSAQSRLWNWKTAWNVVVARPIFGAGFDYYSFKVYALYHPEFLVRWPGKVWVCHSAWFCTLSEHGFPGFFLWAGMVFTVLLGSRRAARAGIDDPSLGWTRDFGDMLAAAIVSFMVSATFLDAAYFDLVYNVVAIAVVLKSAMAISSMTKSAGVDMASAASSSQLAKAQASR